MGHFFSFLRLFFDEKFKGYFDEKLKTVFDEKINKNLFKIHKAYHCFFETEITEFAFFRCVVYSRGI